LLNQQQLLPVLLQNFSAENHGAFHSGLARKPHQRIPESRSFLAHDEAYQLALIYS
jgi:hypothetical protein